MHRRTTRRWVVLVLAASACATGPSLPVASDRGQGFKRTISDPPDPTFPPLETLTAIAAETPPAFDATLRSKAIEFSVPGPRPRQWTPQPADRDVSTRMLATALSGDDRHPLTDHAQCVARALATFVATHGVRADPELRAYILGRCRATWSSVTSGWLSATGAQARNEADWLRRAETRLKRMVAQVRALPTPVEVGIATVQVEGRIVTLVAYGTRSIRMKVVAPSVSGRAIVARGRLASPADTMTALVTRGEFQVARCRFDQRVHLPDFVVSCPAHSGDAQAWIELGALSEGEISGTSVTRLLVSPRPPSRSTFRVPRLGRSTIAVDSVDALTERVVAAINGYRKKAGLPEVRLDVTQSAAAAALAPHYFAAPTDSQRQKTIALGVRAGWKVDGMVRYGRVASAVTSRSDDGRYLLGALYARPYGRQVLMDPDARRIAIAIVRSTEPSVMGILVATYATFEEVDLAQLERAVGERLVAARATRGFGGFREWGIRADDRRQVAEALVADELSASDARHWLVKRYGPESRWKVSAILMRAHRLEELPWPTNLLNLPNPRLDIMAAYRRPRNHAWAQYEVVLLIDPP